MVNSDNFSDNKKKLGEDTGWGDDWEEAFKTEDNPLAPDESEPAEFFQNETKERKITAADKSTSDTSPDSTATIKKARSRVISFQLPSFFNHIVGLSTKQKILTGGAISLLLVVLFFLLLSKESIPPFFQPSQTALKQPVQPEETASVIKNEEIIALPPVVQETVAQEQVSKQWNFPSFFVPISSQTEEESNITFVKINLTLLLLLDEGVALPEDKRVFIRNIIYQFYLNRPLHELRRFSLARGEMGRQLRSWLAKQWPEGTIQTIIFNHYSLT